MKTIQRPSIYVLSPESIGGTAITTSTNAQSTWPAANDALFVPVFLNRPALVKRLFCVNGSAVSGNVDMGIYTNDGARIVSIGSTAQAGTSALQFFDIADTYLSPGQYYMAAAMNNTTGRMSRYNVTIIRMQMLGCFKMATAFALPATATFATPTVAWIPGIGMELVGIL